jgi:hypothetical protein
VILDRRTAAGKWMLRQHQPFGPVAPSLSELAIVTCITLRRR